MDELHQRIARASEVFDDDWERERIDRMLDGVPERQQTLRRNRRITAAAASLAALALFAGLGALLHDGAQGTAMPPDDTDKIAMAPTEVSFSKEKPVQLADGSKVTPGGPGSDVRVTRVTEDLITVDLKAGQARFEVAHKPARTFRVRVGDATVEVLGTVFTVERRPSQIHVAVERGHVRVTSPSDGPRELRAGQQATISYAARAQAAPEPVDTPASADADEARPGSAPPRRASKKRRKTKRGPSWQALAEKGEFRKAAETMNKNKVQVRDKVAELLLASDVMRFAAEPKRAIVYLDRIVRSHRNDRRAPLAQFTKGRILLRQLGQPRQAARAFAKLERMKPEASLAEDALAREVEAWSRCGERAKAKQRALDYMRSHPRGYHRKLVRRFGGLDETP